MNVFLLKTLDLFSFLFRWLGVNYNQLRVILEVKLSMDNRRQIVAYRKKNNQDPENTFLWTLFFYSLFGAFVALAIYSIPSFMIAMIMFFSYVMVMIAMTLITDFSSILLDTSDNTIILPRPVDSRTLFVARLTHIILYLGQITIGLVLVPSVVVLLKYGVAMLILFVLATGLSVLASVFLTNTLYLLILQFASEEKLRNVINYFQIVMAVFIMGGYQLLPRVAGRMNVEELGYEIQWWSFVTPPVWMAGALETYYLKIFDGAHLALTGCAVVIPVAGFFLVNRYLTPLFTKKLGVLGTENKAKVRKEKKSLISNISAWLTSSQAERGSFETIYQLLGRDRKIKLKIYPAFGYVAVFGAIFLFRSNEDFITTWNSLPGTQYHLLLLYLTFMILQVAIHEIAYSDDFKACWIYFSAPLKGPGEILTGAIKAIVVRLFIPGYILISILVLSVWGIDSIGDIVFGLFNNVMMLLIILLVNKRSLPLSLSPNIRNQAGSFVRSLLLILLMGIIGVAHYLLTKNTIMLLAAMPAQLLLILVLYRKYGRTTWEKLTL